MSDPREAISVAGVIEPTLEAAEIRRASERPTNDLSAYDLYLLALPHAATYQWDHTLQALDLLQRAIERDPNFASALARAAGPALLTTGGILLSIGRATAAPAPARRAIKVLRDHVGAGSAFVGSLSDQALEGLRVADYNRAFSEIDQPPTLPILEDLVYAFAAAAAMLPSSR